MHHWITSTSSTIGLVSGPDIEHIWQVVVPGQAQAHPYLMQSLLALAAAHMAYLDKSQHALFFGIARRHHIKASTLFRSHATYALSQPKSVPALAFVILTGLTSLALLQDEGNNHLQFLDTLCLVRHSLRIGATCKRVAGTEDVNVANIMIGSEFHPNGLLDLDEQLKASLDILDSVNLASSTTSTARKSTISHAIRQTRGWYQCVPLHPPNLVYIPHWAILVTDEYMNYLRDMDPVAIALLAHWIVAVYNAPKKWYISDWPERIVAIIARRLGQIGPAANNMIEWVLTQVPIPNVL